jgi:hypothetical protein
VEVEDRTPEENEVPNSPIYCEGIHFSLPTVSSSELPSEPTDTVHIEVDINANLEDEYCEPVNVDYETMAPAQANTEYETMDPTEGNGEYESMDPTEDNGEYEYTYEHMNIKTSYENWVPGAQAVREVEDNYEYPQTSRKCSDGDYHYAYGWLNSGFRASILSSDDPMVGYTPLDEEKMNDTTNESYQTLSRENLEEESETGSVEYVVIL